MLRVELALSQGWMQLSVLAVPKKKRVQYHFAIKSFASSLNPSGSVGGSP